MWWEQRRSLHMECLWKHKKHRNVSLHFPSLTQSNYIVRQQNFAAYSIINHDADVHSRICTLLSCVPLSAFTWNWVANSRIESIDSANTPLLRFFAKEGWQFTNLSLQDPQAKTQPSVQKLPLHSVFGKNSLWQSQFCDAERCGAAGRIFPPQFQLWICVWR